MSHDATITRTCRAKLNLALAVGAPLPESGYHPIASWMVPIEFGDELHVYPLTAGQRSTFEITWAADALRPTPIDWTVKQDLVYRAHAAFQERFGKPVPVAVRLEKYVPVGAGLGGGSSDAAMMLNLLNAIVGKPFTHTELASIASTLGSDIPFFIDPQPAYVTGLGEVILPLPEAPPDSSSDAVPAYALLIFPEFGCPTGPVYKAFDDIVTEPEPDHARVQALIDRQQTFNNNDFPADDLFNDLAEPAMRVQPQLRHIRDALQALVNQPVHVTGSGSTLFTMTHDLAQARRWSDQLGKQFTRHIVRVCL